MVGEGSSTSTTGALDKDKNSTPHRSFPLHSTLHTLFICTHDFWSKEVCFHVLSEKWFGGKEDAMAEFFEMTHPLPVPYQKQTCRHKASSREMQEYLLAFWKGIWLNWGQHHLSLRFTISGWGTLHNTRECVHWSLCQNGCCLSSSWIQARVLHHPPTKLANHHYLWQVSSFFLF